MPRKTARGIVVHNGRVLLMERWRHDKATGAELHYFSVPGGGIKPSELPEVAVVRELFEEMQVVVRPRSVALTSTDKRGDFHTYFLCDYLSGTPLLGTHSPEYLHASDTDRYKPQWVNKAAFAKIPLNQIYEPARPIIASLLD